MQFTDNDLQLTSTIIEWDMFMWVIEGYDQI
jgi:hypothetical protein